MKFLLAAFLSLSPPAFADDMTLLGVGQQPKAASASGCTAATNYLARTSGGNEGGNAANITTLICGLVSDGVITGNLSGATGGCGTTLDTLYILAQQNSTDSILNLCGTSYSLSAENAPTFTSYSGWAFGTSGYFDTGFNASTATSPNFIQNNATYGFWSYAKVNENVGQMGNGSGANSSNILNSYSSSTFYGRINSAAGSAGGVTTPGTKGEYTTERLSSTSTILYWDGTSQGTVTDTSASPKSADFTVGTVIGLGSTGQTICEAHIGAHLGATLETDLYTRLRTYMTAVGVP